MADGSQQLLDLLRGSAPQATVPPPTINTGSSSAFDILFTNFGAPQAAPSTTHVLVGSSPSISTSSPLAASGDGAASLLAALNGTPLPTSAPPLKQRSTPSQLDSQRLLSLLQSPPRSQDFTQVSDSERRQSSMQESLPGSNQGRILLEQLLAGQGQGQGVQRPQQKPTAEATPLGTETFALETETCVAISFDQFTGTVLVLF
jgi:hypothetical protein